MINWYQWHHAYDDSPVLQSRLALVQSHLSIALDHYPDSPIRIISLCAGDGRDLIPVLAQHPRRQQVQAVLIEQDTQLVHKAQLAVSSLGVTRQIVVREADATVLASYHNYVPATIVLVCGVFGNVRAADTPRLVQTIRGLCDTHGTVIWTRHCSTPDGQQGLDQLRSLFRTAGFIEERWQYTSPNDFVVASYRSVREPIELDAQPLFVFTGYTNM